MARILFCEACDAPTGVLVKETVMSCATCFGPIVWREMAEQPFTLTHQDRAWLKQLRISPK
jgi:hypothetical protein